MIVATLGILALEACGYLFKHGLYLEAAAVCFIMVILLKMDDKK